jgi:GNAT superfamily N-acetyltransferase
MSGTSADEPLPHGIHLKNVQHLAEQAARLCAQQWPSMSMARRRTAMCIACLHNRNDRKLPCHLLLTDESQSVALAHCKLGATQDDEHGFGILLTSLVVAPNQRRRGLGRMMLQYAEEFAFSLGAGYLALSTGDMQSFYLACGFTVRDHPTLTPKPQVSKQDAAAVSAVIGGGCERADRETPDASQSAHGWRKGEMTEYVLGKLAKKQSIDDDEDESAATAEHTWFRKALQSDSSELLVQRRHVWTQQALADNVLKRLAPEKSGIFSGNVAIDAVAGFSAIHAPPRLLPSPASPVHITPCFLAWEQQVGGTCGIVVLRMARSYFHGWDDMAHPTQSTRLQREQSVTRRAGPQLAQLGLNCSDGDGPLVHEHHAAIPLEKGIRASSAESVLQAALSAGFTNYGELFDASDFARLASTCCGLHATVLSYSDGDTVQGDQAWQVILQWLGKGGLAAVPYAKAPLPTADVLPAGGAPDTAHYLLVVGTAYPHATDPVLIAVQGMSPVPLIVPLSALRSSNEGLRAQPIPRHVRIHDQRGMQLCRRIILLS